MSNHSNKIITDAKLLIALWENTPTNVMRANIIGCIESGADVNVRFLNDGNNTPLHIAVIKGDRELVNLLLRYGARADIANDKGKTALQLAKELTDCSDIFDELVAAVDEPTDKEDALIAGEDAHAPGAVCTYKKRPGTANVRGQLYETKLLTLIYLRAARCRHITKFCMGTNVDEIGDIDDVCLRFKTVNDDYVIFLQAKHKDNVVKGRMGFDDLWRPNGDFSLPKYFASYKKIREKFNPDSDDELFCGKYEDVKRFYVIYTTVIDDIECRRKMLVVSDEVTDLLGTGEHLSIFQLKTDEECIKLLTKAVTLERIRNIGKKLFHLIQDNKPDKILWDEDIRRFHVVLAQKVINVSEINTEGRRTGTFREEFFCSNDELLIVLRETLYEEATKVHKLSKDETYISIMRLSLSPEIEIISNLIGNILTYDSNNHKLIINDEPDENYSQLQYMADSLQLSQSDINVAFEIAGRRELCSLKFDLPAAFGNLDMTITANKKRAERRLEFLANKISDVIRETADAEGNVVLREGEYAVGKRMEAGVLAVNGGIAGAVGNLIVADDGNKLKFNLDGDTLSENAKSLLLKLQNRHTDLHKYRFITENENFPRLSLHATEVEKSFVMDFFDNLYFYTSQAKEDQVEEIGVKELQVNDCRDSFSKAESRVRSNALFLRLHSEIQTWWMTEQKVPYLSRNSFDKIFREFKNKGLLSFLNFIYLNEMTNVGLEFVSDAVEVLSVCRRDTRDLKTIVVRSDVPLLTCHKLVQIFRDIQDYIFLDFDYLSRVSPSGSLMINQELADTNIRNVVIICNDVSKYKDVIGSLGCKKRIVVTSNNNMPTEECVLVNDDRINLTDLTEASQRKLLTSKFSFQGIEITFAEVFNEEMKHLIGPKILEKILNNEYITLGQPLTMSTYEEIKHYFVPRIMRRNERFYSAKDTPDVDYAMPSSSDSEDDRWESRRNDSDSYKRFSPLTLIDHHDIFKKKQKKRIYDVILVIDAPGMGKSTLLTHLSLETKKRYPKIWIERINLIDHTKQFHDWHEKNIEVNSEEALKFVCRAVLSKESSSGHIRILHNNNVDLEIVNNEIKLIHNEQEDVMLDFELNTFLYCFNEGDITFLVDGFDEICPHYKKEVMQLLKFLASRTKISDAPEEKRDQKRSTRCVWITSRPYNDLRETLEKEFGESYTLQPFSYKNICIYLDKYMRRNLDLNALTSAQLRNINGFFEYMKQFDLYNDELAQDVGLVNIPLHSVYVAAMEYFKSEIKRSHISDDNLVYIQNWDLEINKLIAWRKHLHDYERLHDVLTLSGVPLHVYIAIHYFQSQVKDTTLTDPEQLIHQWDLDTNAFAFYERFIETKLKTIRFEEKNRMDIFNPDVKMTYEKEKKEFLDNHKKLAFYSICSKRLFLDDELEEITDIIKTMKVGKDKTGFIDRIVDDTPRFVHYTFAEYFAVEYILDMLKSSDADKQERMLDFVLYNMVYNATNGILNLFDLKIKYDPVFGEVMNTPHVSKFVFDILIEQSKEEYPYDVYEDYIGNPDDLTATALDKAVGRGMIQFATFLLNILTTVVDETNFADVMKHIETGTFFKKLIVSNRDELVGSVLDCIRRFDASKIDNLFPYRLFDNHIHSQTTNEQFIEAYHAKLLEQFLLSLQPNRRNRHMSQ